MRPIHRGVCSAVALAAWAASPAAAQEPKWDRDIESRIEQHVEAVAKQIEHLVEHHVEHIADDVKHAVKHQVNEALRTFKLQVVLAQRNRQAGEAARRASQQAREAERRRREEARSGPEYTEQISKTLRLGRNGTFDLQNLSGDIVVTGGGGNDVRVEATKRVRHQRESEARALLQSIVVRIDER